MIFRCLFIYLSYFQYNGKRTRTNKLRILFICRLNQSKRQNSMGFNLFRCVEISKLQKVARKIYIFLQNDCLNFRIKEISYLILANIFLKPFWDFNFVINFGRSIDELKNAYDTYKAAAESRHFVFHNEQLEYLVSIRITEFLLQSVTLDH